jgi:hypothetical protein
MGKQINILFLISQEDNKKYIFINFIFLFFIDKSKLLNSINSDLKIINIVFR